MTVLAVVPARGGSKGVPGKNVRKLGGVPLVVHAVRFAQSAPPVDRVVVTTDSERIAAVARDAGAEVPFLRPAELARDDTPMWPVVEHALAQVDPSGAVEHVVLVDPTSPARDPGDVGRAVERLQAAPDADGVVSVSPAGFSVVWQSVLDRDGRLELLFPDAAGFGRRQDTPEVLKIDGSLYVFRASFVRSGVPTWLEGRLLAQRASVPETLHVDEAGDLERAEALLAAGLIRLPWLDGA